jgi:hypothetical protein
MKTVPDILLILLIFIFIMPVQSASGANALMSDTPTLPHIFNIGSTTDTSTLSMLCYGDEPYEIINCTFSQINIRKPVDGTCAISEYLFSETMHKVSKKRWDSEVYGGGMRTIESDSSTGVLWKYREVTNDTPSKVLTYSWDATTEYSLESLGCKKLKFLGTNKDTIGIEQPEMKK